MKNYLLLLKQQLFKNKNVYVQKEELKENKNAKQNVSWAVFYRGYKSKHHAELIAQINQLSNWGPRNQVLEVLEYFASEDEAVTFENVATSVKVPFSTSYVTNFKYNQESENSSRQT